MIRAEFTDYITAQDGRVVRYVEARWPATRSHKAGRTTVYREFENGKKQVRKLCFHPIAGYMVDEGDLSSWTSAILECRALSDGYNVYGHDLSEEETQKREKIDLRKMGIGLFVSGAFFCLGIIINKFRNVSAGQIICFFKHYLFLIGS